MNKRLIRRLIFLAAIPLLIWAGFQIKEAHYPIDIPPSAHWETFANSLPAAREQFFIDRDGVLLEADLFVPTGGRSAKPAIVFSVGSGDSVYQNYSPDMVETAVLELFLQRDMAVMLVNKRGMGASEGNYTKSDFQDRSDDLYAAVTTLQSHPAIDANQIGLVGHSQGGYIVTLTAAQHPDIAFIISLAGPAVTVAEQFEDNFSQGYFCDGYRGEELAQKTASQMRLARLGARFGQTIPFGMFGYDAGIIDYDPAQALLDVKIPALLIFGERDRLVSPPLNLSRLDAIFDGRLPDHLSTATIGGVNHGFLAVETACSPAAANTIAPDLLAVMNTWLDEQGY